jgi:hypothetical protein
VVQELFDKTEVLGHLALLSRKTRAKSMVRLTRHPVKYLEAPEEQKSPWWNYKPLKTSEICMQISHIFLVENDDGSDSFTAPHHDKIPVRTAPSKPIL